MSQRLRLGLLVALVPALILSALWNWARDHSRSLPVEVIPAPLDTGVDIDNDLTPMLSPRRVAEATAASASRALREAALEEIAADIADDGCLIVTDDGSSLIEHRSTEAFEAHEAVSLLIAAVAADQLGPSFAWRTAALGPEPLDGQLPGNLYVIGGGDAFLSTDDLGTESGVGGVHVDVLVDALVAGGVTTIDGDVVAVASRYPEVFRTPGDPETASALVIDGGRILTSPLNRGLDPAQTAARTLVELLRRAGITVSGSARVGEVDEPAVMLAVIDGLPLVELLSSFGAGDPTAWSIATWNWAIESGSGSDATVSLMGSLSTAETVVAEWGVPRPTLLPDDAVGDSAMSCAAVAEAVRRLDQAGARLPVGNIEGSEVIGLEIPTETAWVLAEGALESGAVATAIGDREILLTALAEADRVVTDGETQIEANLIMPVGSRG